MKISISLLILLMLGFVVMAWADGVNCNEFSISLRADSAVVAYRGGILFQDALVNKTIDNFQNSIRRIKQDMSEYCSKNRPVISVIPYDFKNLNLIASVLSQTGFESFAVLFPQKELPVSKERMLEVLTK